MGNTLSARGSRSRPKKWPVSVQPLAAIADKASLEDLRNMRIPIALGPALPPACHVDPVDGSIRNDAAAPISSANQRDDLSETDSIIEEYRARNIQSPLPFGPSGSRTFPVTLSLGESFVKPKAAPLEEQPHFWPGQLLSAFTIEQRLVIGLGSESSQESMPHGRESNDVVCFNDSKGTTALVYLQAAVLAHFYNHAARCSSAKPAIVTRKYALPKAESLGVLSMALGTCGFVDLSGIGISQLTPDVACFQGLTVLCLSRNALQTLPENIGLLSGLRSLRLSDNRLTSVPHSIGMLTNLKSLYLDRNRLTAIPTSIQGLGRLRTLNIAFNCLKTLPRETGCLQRLATLEAEHNLICWLPAEIALLPNTRRIQLGGNPLLTVADLKLAEKQLSAPPGPGSLAERAARCLVREDIQIATCPETQNISALTPSLLLTLQTAQWCAFCRGPMFGRSYSRFRIVRRHEQDIPFVHVLCEAHWRDERMRCIALFAPLPDTAPNDVVSALRDGTWLNVSTGSMALPPIQGQIGKKRYKSARKNIHASSTSTRQLVLTLQDSLAPRPAMPQYAPLANRTDLVLADSEWIENLVFDGNPAR